MFVCVGGRQEAGWCVWVLFWCHLGVLSSHCCGVYSLHFPESSVGFFVGEVGGTAVCSSRFHNIFIVDQMPSHIPGPQSLRVGT